MFRLSLAALRYRAVLSLDGGPIDSLEEGPFEVFGRRFFQANARLEANLVPWRPKQLYSDADGTGLHSSPMIASHMAISEALERWAYYATVDSPSKRTHGFHIDPSSNGMAAFPGLLRHNARTKARLEAGERYCLLHWWERRIDGKVLATRWPGITAVCITSPLGGCAVILFMRSDQGFYAYGHAAAATFDKACEHARLELVRHEWAISSWNRLGGRQPPQNTFEHRAWYFSTDEGYGLFQERLGMKVKSLLPRPEAICDSEIRGPWSRYTTVWRYLLRPPSSRFAGADGRYFFW